MVPDVTWRSYPADEKDAALPKTDLEGKQGPAWVLCLCLSDPVGQLSRVPGTVADIVLPTFTVVLRNAQTDQSSHCLSHLHHLYILNAF